MKCPYCSKEISGTVIYCPECGQIIKQEQSNSASESYWNAVENDDKKRNQEYIRTINQQRSAENSRKAKKLAMIVAIITLVVVAVLVVVNVTNTNNAELEAVKGNLVGRELKCSYSQTETGFWIHYYYYTLKFNSDGTLDCYYLTTVGPAEKDEVPTLKGTYRYSITRSITGDYYITFGNESFTLTVSDNNIPKSISYGK